MAFFTALNPKILAFLKAVPVWTVFFCFPGFFHPLPRILLPSTGCLHGLPLPPRSLPPETPPQRPLPAFFEKQQTSFSIGFVSSQALLGAFLMFFHFLPVTVWVSPSRTCTTQISWFQLSCPALSVHFCGQRDPILLRSPLDLLIYPSPPCTSTAPPLGLFRKQGTFPSKGICQLSELPGRSFLILFNRCQLPELPGRFFLILFNRCQLPGLPGGF